MAIRNLSFQVGLLAMAMLGGLPAAIATDGDGRCVLSFTPVVGDVVEGDRISVPTDARGTWTITYTVGKDGMAKGGGIWIKRLGWWDSHFGFFMQMEDPTSEDYVTCHTTSRTGKIKNVADDLSRYFKEQNMLHVVVSDGRLVEDDQIIIIVGDRSGGGPGSVTTPVAWPDRKVFVQSDTNGDGNYGNLPEPMLVSFEPGKATRFEVIAPSTVNTDQSFELLIRAEDVNSNVQPEAQFDRLPHVTVEGEPAGITPIEQGCTGATPTCTPSSPTVRTTWNRTTRSPATSPVWISAV